MTMTPNPKLTINSLDGKSHSLDDLTTMFTQLWIVLPAKAETKEYEAVTQNIFNTFGESDARCAILIPGDPRAAQLVHDELDIKAQYFVDQDMKVCEALGVTQVPALVYMRQDTQVTNIVNGFDVNKWNQECKKIAKTLRCTNPSFAKFSNMANSSYSIQ